MILLAESLVELMAFFFAAPLGIAFHSLAFLATGRRDQIYQGFSQLVGLAPGLPGDRVRRAFYRMTLAHCDKQCSIGFGTIFATPEVTICSGVYVGPYSTISHAVISQDTLIGSNVHIISGRHAHGADSLETPIRLQARHHTVIRIGADCWIGNGSIIMANVGSQTIVGAGSVVTREQPARVVIAGNPARVLRSRERDSSAMERDC